MSIKYETEFTDEKLRVLTDYSMNYNKKTVWLVIIYRIIEVFLGCSILCFASIVPDASVVYYILAFIFFVLAVIEGPLMKKSLYLKSKKINVPFGTKRECSFSEEGLTIITNSEQLTAENSLNWHDAKEYCEMGNFLVIHFQVVNAFVPVELDKISLQDKDQILKWLQSNQAKELPPKKKVRRKRILIQIPVIAAIILLCLLWADGIYTKQKKAIYSTPAVEYEMDKDLVESSGKSADDLAMEIMGKWHVPAEVTDDGGVKIKATDAQRDAILNGYEKMIASLSKDFAKDHPGCRIDVHDNCQKIDYYVNEYKDLSSIISFNHLYVCYYCRCYQAMSGNDTDDITISIYNNKTGKLVASGNDISITEDDWEQSEE